MRMRTHLHAELIQAISTIIEHSPHQLNFYKVKAHSGVIGNEGDDVCAQTAVLMDNTDIALPDAKDPFHNFFWLSVNPPQGHSHNPTPLYLTNLEDKLKAHMHIKHKLGSADISSCYYTGWQQLMQPPSHNSNTDTGIPKLSPKLANQKISNSFWSNPKVTLQQQINLLKYRTGTIYTQKHAVRFNHTSGSANC
mmetsp:Transcript_24768/g.67507  ORF Transcript_24768/g.67507 Transcript_24768/m.67507 type:complete len:194 (-) Transcript_24768:62-643(-)